MSDHTIGEGLAGVAAELAGLTKAVDALTEKVGEQNGRIGRLENERAAQQVRSVEQARSEMACDNNFRSLAEVCDKRMGNMGNRVTNLETFRDTSKGKAKAALGIFQTVATILTLLVALYAIIEARPQQTATPAAQHQAK